MHKIWFFSLAVILAISIPLTSCSRKNDAISGASKHPGNIKRNTEENSVDLNEGLVRQEYKRIVSVSAGAVETIYMIGGETHLVGIGKSREGIWPQEKTSQLPSVGNLAQPSIEAIIKLEPDLVILNTMVTELGTNLKNRGLKVYLHEAGTMEEILRSTEELGVFCGRPDEAAALVKEKTQNLEELKKRFGSDNTKLKGAFLYSANPILAFTEKSLPGEILKLLGVKNLAEGLDMARPMLSPEYILKEDPDFLFCAMSITKPEDLMEPNAFLEKTRAGREGNIMVMSSSFFLRPSPRLFDELPELAAQLDELR